MKKQLLYIITGLLISLNSFAINHYKVSELDSINDGPYFSFEDNYLKVKCIINNVIREYYVRHDNFETIKNNFNLLFSYRDLSKAYLLKPEYGQSYKNIDSIAVITDIHGEFGTYMNLLKANGIIDDNLNWKFGHGHLVVLGDIFDRGDMVTEVFWHLFGLEKQAAKAGGKVHVILGNHELMVLSKEIGYINEKYRKVEVIFNTPYSDLFSETSVLGKWLRTMPVIITINDILFVHAGVSAEMLERQMKISTINRLFTNNIVGKDMRNFYENEKLKFLDGENGPLWYRGYFTDTSFCESKLDPILDFYGKNHIVVGHTTHKGIISLFNNKILGADTGIMYKKPGEMLLYINGSFYKGSSTGKRTRL